VLVTLAGPGSNAVLALGFAVVGGLLLRFVPGTEELFPVILIGMAVNVGLIIFNLLPIPPLDGSRVVRHLIGMSEETFVRISLYSGIALLILINIPAFRAFLGFIHGIAMTPFIGVLEAIVAA
jgi:Zn-dependent protease